MGDGNEIGDYEFNDTKAPLNDCLEQRNWRGHAKRLERELSQQKSKKTMIILRSLI